MALRYLASPVAEKLQISSTHSLKFRRGKKQKPHIYTDCTDFRRCIENKNKLVKQTEIVAKCFAIIWWLQQQQTNKQWEHYKNPPLPSPQPIFFSIQCCHNEGKAPSFALVLWIDDGCHGTFVDWILTLRNRRTTSVSTTVVNFRLTNHSTQTFDSAVPQVWYQ